MGDHMGRNRRLANPNGPASLFAIEKHRYCTAAGGEPSLASFGMPGAARIRDVRRGMSATRYAVRWVSEPVRGAAATGRRGQGVGVSPHCTVFAGRWHHVPGRSSPTPEREGQP